MYLSWRRKPPPKLFFPIQNSGGGVRGYFFEADTVLDLRNLLLNNKNLKL